MPSARVPATMPGGYLLPPGRRSLLFLLHLIIQARHLQDPYDHLWVASVVKINGRGPVYGLRRLQHVCGPNLSVRQSHVIIVFINQI